MVPVSHSFDSADFFGLLAVRRIAIPYPLQPATQLLEEDIGEPAGRTSPRPTMRLTPGSAGWSRWSPPARTTERRWISGTSGRPRDRRGGAVRRSADLLVDQLHRSDRPGHRGARRTARSPHCSNCCRPGARWSSPRSPCPSRRSTQIGSASATDSDRERIARAAGTNLDAVRSALASVGASTGAGQIGALVRSPQGDAVRSTSLVVVVDGATGRLLRLSGTAPGGQRLASLAPARPLPFTGPSPSC